MRSYRMLDGLLRSQTKSAVIKFSKDPNTKSLRFKPLAGVGGIYSFRVNDNFRVLVRVVEDVGGTYYLLMDVGNHDIYSRL